MNAGQFTYIRRKITQRTKKKKILKINTKRMRISRRIKRKSADGPTKLNKYDTIVNV